MLTNEDKEIFCCAGMTIGAAVAVLVGVGVGVAAAVGVAAGVAIGDADQTRQTFFFPAFLQTNLLSGVSKNAPVLLHVLPTLGAAAVAVLAITPRKRALTASKTVNFRIG